MKHDHSHVLLNEREARSITEALAHTDTTELATYPLGDDRQRIVGLLVATSGGLIQLSWEGLEVTGSFTPWRQVKARLTWKTTFENGWASGPAARAKTIGTLDLPDLSLKVEYQRERDEEWRDFTRVVREETSQTKPGGN